MVNREIIRLKVVQLVYASMVTGETDVEKGERELLFALQKTFDLYHSMLQLMVDLYNVGCRRLATEEAKVQRLGEGSVPSPRWAANRFVQQLEANEELRKYCSDQKLGWTDEEEFLARVFRRVSESEYYRRYLQSDDIYESDRALWHDIYRNELCENDFIDDILERQSLYWNDDRHVVSTFVLKTIKNFGRKAGAEQELLPQFRDEGDRTFACTLLRSAIKGSETYRDMIAANVKGWDLNRLATMDLVIMQVALAEIINCEGIAVGVSMNEYIEIAKAYSTPQSGGYVNGLLDQIVHKLAADGIISKEVR